jgi:putative ABC transport system ATP-binding protein
MMIKTEHLSKIFRTEEVETKALNDVNLHVEKGEFAAIMGHQAVVNLPY